MLKVELKNKQGRYVFALGAVYMSVIMQVKEKLEKENRTKYCLTISRAR